MKGAAEWLPTHSRCLGAALLLYRLNCFFSSSFLFGKLLIHPQNLRKYQCHISTALAADVVRTSYALHMVWLGRKAVFAVLAVATCHCFLRSL